MAIRNWGLPAYGTYQPACSMPATQQRRYLIPITLGSSAINAQWTRLKGVADVSPCCGVESARVSCGGNAGRPAVEAGNQELRRCRSINATMLNEKPKAACATAGGFPVDANARRGTSPSFSLRWTDAGTHNNTVAEYQHGRCAVVDSSSASYAGVAAVRTVNHQDVFGRCV